MMKSRNFLIFAAMLVSLARLAPATTITVAHDTAANPAYDDGWDKGDDGGFGFQPWYISFNGDSNQLDPVYNGKSHFIDGVDVGPMPSGGLDPRTFGMTTSRQLDVAAAQRSFDEPLGVGRSFRMLLDGSAYEVGQFTGIGNKFQLLGADGVPRYELSSTENAQGRFWSVNGSNTGVRYDEPAVFHFSPQADDRYGASLQSLVTNIGHASFNAQLGGTPNTPITGLRFENIGTGSSVDGATEIFFNDLEVLEFVPESATGTLTALSLLALAGWLRHRS